MNRGYWVSALVFLFGFVLCVGSVPAQDWESNGVDSSIPFNSAGGAGLDFTPNSDGSHWLWRHNDGSSNPVEYGAQLNSGNGKVWRIENVSSNKELAHVSTNGDFYLRGGIDGVDRSIRYRSAGGEGLDFRPNSDGTHWLWVHNDGTSGGTEYGVQLASGEGEIWRLFNRNTWNVLMDVGTNGQMYVRGNVGVGTQSPSKKLTVAGHVLAEEVVIKPQDQWSDFVFADSYDLPSLGEVSSFIEQNGRLPDVPSAEAVKNNGLRVGEMDATLLQKVEELTLYAIEQKERADSLTRGMDILRDRLRDTRQAQARQKGQIERLRKELSALREKVTGQD